MKKTKKRFILDKFDITYPQVYVSKDLHQFHNRIHYVSQSIPELSNTLLPDYNIFLQLMMNEKSDIL